MSESKVWRCDGCGVEMTGPSPRIVVEPVVNGTSRMCVEARFRNHMLGDRPNDLCRACGIKALRIAVEMLTNEREASAEKPL